MNKGDNRVINQADNFNFDILTLSLKRKMNSIGFFIETLNPISVGMSRNCENRRMVKSGLKRNEKKGQPFAIIKFHYYYVSSSYFMITPKTLSLNLSLCFVGPVQTGPYRTGSRSMWTNIPQLIFS